MLDRHAPIRQEKVHRMDGRIVTLEVRPPSARVLAQGIQDKLRIYARLLDQRCPRNVAYILAHPNVNYMHHYLMEPLHRRGRAVLGLNTRYIGNDVTLLMERVIQDLGAGVRYLREQGFERVIFIGNSGGGSRTWPDENIGTGSNSSPRQITGRVSVC